MGEEEKKSDYDRSVTFMARMAACAFLGALTAVFVAAGAAGVMALLG